MILTLRATAVPAGMGPPHGVIAFGAVHEQLTRRRRPAASDCIDGVQVTRQQLIVVLVQQRIEVLIEDGGKLHDHRLLRSTCKELTRRLIVAEVSCSVIGVRWA